MAKFLLLLLAAGALADAMAATRDPPLLIDSAPSAVTLDAAN
jgi:hypothetical protein